jgi:hypothetical protein
MCWYCTRRFAAAHARIRWRLFTAPGRFLDDENRRQGQEQTEHSHGDEQDAQLAVIRRHQGGTGRLVAHLSGDEEELVQVFGAEGAEGQRQVGD